MFSLQSTLATLAALATTSHAIYFHLDPFVVSDIRIPSESHSISFTVSNPPATIAEQGGPLPQDCAITWSGSSVPTCWTACAGPGPQYYARVQAGSYIGAYNFTLEVEQYHFRRGTHRFNAMIPVLEGSGGYGCSRGGQSTVCTIRGEPAGLDSELTSDSFVEPRDNVCDPAVVAGYE